MFGDQKDIQKNLKDSSNNSGITIKDSLTSISYTKTNKLITALYMVTDIIDPNEPLRNKLRTLGVEIISDMHLIIENNIGHLASNIHSKISQILSFLEIASTINIISEMNTNILRKEFLELNQSILESNASVNNRQINLSEFFQDEPATAKGVFGKKQYHSIGHSIGHNHTSVGVQKGSTLMKALSSIKDIHKNNPVPYEAEGFHSGFDILKKQRREDILSIIKIVGGNATIKDIRDKAQGSIISCGEKTLQRELVSMIKDNILNKTGEKRWSRYFLKG